MGSGLINNADKGLTAIRIIGGPLHMVLPNPSARTVLGLKSVSEKLYEPLGWYFWLEKFPGAYSFELIEDELPAENRFLMRYFPTVDDPMFSALSEEERTLRQSSLFDNTGTPAQSEGPMFDPELFSVGVVDLRTSSAGPEAGLNLSLVTRPEWTRDTAWLLFDFLVCMLCHYYGLAMHHANQKDILEENLWMLHCHMEPSAGCGLGAESREWLNPIWWRPEGLGITNADVEYVD